MSPLRRPLRYRTPPVSVTHEDCWAKTTPNGQEGISVAQHCRTAGIVAGLLAAQRPTWLAGPLSIRPGVVLAAIHDVGKVSPGFQRKCAAWLQRHRLTAAACLGEEDHAKVSQRTLQDILSADSLRFWAAIVGAHHGRLKGDRLPPLVDGGDAWSAERRRLVAELVQEFGHLPDQPPPACDCAMLWFNAGLIAVADWLASDERTFPPSKVLDVAGIRERADKQLQRIGFRSISCPSGKGFADLFPSLPAPNALQTLLAESVRRPGIYVVEASMGCGKTEAALVAAYNLLATGQATGLYFALPTQVTSNRIHERVAAFISRFSPEAGTRLIHGNSWLLEIDPPLTDSHNGETKEWTGRDWFASPRRALIAPFGVGTVDQALLGIVAAKHFFVRQFGLAGKVVILDEVHSYDLYTGTLLDLLVDRLRELGATVIILSATLTTARRRGLLGIEDSVTFPFDSTYPLVSANIDGDFMQQPVEPEAARTIQVRFPRSDELAEDCLDRAQRGQCVLWIRNTVDAAQDTYRLLRGLNRVGGPEIALLHARFPQFRRAQLENDWLERLGKDHSKRPTHGCILVSTQVAEQSVDIDADLLITDLAPTDMLLQRLGRLWRHPSPRPAGCTCAEVWIASPTLDAYGLRTATAAVIKAAFGKSSRVYAPYVLLRTFDQWRVRTELVLPADIRSILEATYADLPAEPPAWRELCDDLTVRKDKLRNFAIANSTPWQVALNDDEGVQTRWNSCPTVAVLPVRKVRSWDKKTGASVELLNGDRCEVGAGVFVFAAAQALHRNLVKVPRWCVASHLGFTPAWLREYVAGDTVLCKLCDGRLLALPGGDDSGLTYRDDLGVVIPTWNPHLTAQRTEEDDSESYD